MTAGGKKRTGFSTRAKGIIGALTAIVGLATGTLTLRDQLFGGKTRDSPSGLRVDDLVVSNPAEVQLHQPRSSSSFPASLSERTKPTIELKLHNLSSRTVDLTGARFVVLGYARVARCVSAGGLPLSGTYDVLLPANPRVGASVSTTLNEQTASDGLGRFRFRFDAPLSAYEDGSVTLIYRLGIQLWHDANPKPFPAGTVMLSFPRALSPGDYSNFWDAASAQKIDTIRLIGGPGAEQCDHANAALLSRLLAEPGVRSIELAHLTSDVGA